MYRTSVLEKIGYMNSKYTVFLLLLFVKYTSKSTPRLCPMGEFLIEVRGLKLSYSYGRLTTIKVNLCIGVMGPK